MDFCWCKESARTIFPEKIFIETWNHSEAFENFCIQEVTLNKLLDKTQPQPPVLTVKGFPWKKPSILGSDAFGTAHRGHSSMVGEVEFGMGQRLLLRESVGCWGFVCLDGISNAISNMTGENDPKWHLKENPEFTSLKILKKNPEKSRFVNWWMVCVVGTAHSHVSEGLGFDLVSLGLRAIRWSALGFWWQRTWWVWNFTEQQASNHLLMLRFSATHGSFMYMGCFQK